MTSSSRLAPEALVPLALGLSRWLEHYVPLSTAPDDVGGEPDGPHCDPEALLAAQLAVHGPGIEGPPSRPDLVDGPPIIVAWVTAIADLATSSDQDLALAGLRARRWLRDLEADRERQRRACVALGLDHGALVAAQAAERLPAVLLAAVDRLSAHVALPGADRLPVRGERSTWWAALDEAERERWRTAELELVAALSLSGDVGKVRSAWIFAQMPTRPLRAKPWLWPWESRPNSSDERPYVYPPDFRSEWRDHAGAGHRVTPGECLVVEVEQPAATLHVVERLADVVPMPTASRRSREDSTEVVAEPAQAADTLTVTTPTSTRGRSVVRVPAVPPAEWGERPDPGWWR